MNRAELGDKWQRQGRDARQVGRGRKARRRDHRPPASSTIWCSLILRRVVTGLPKWQSSSVSDPFGGP
jgi:hypothetical protein